MRRFSTASNAVRTVVLALTSAVYFGLPLALRQPSSEPPRYSLYAHALLAGRLSLPDAPAGAAELARGNDGRWYVAYPPLPAVLMLPAAAVWGEQSPVWPVVALVSVLNVLLFDVWLLRLVPGLGWQRPGTMRGLFAALFAFGTMTWHVALVGRDWHLAHSLGVACFLLGMIEHAGRRRWPRIGLWAALSGACRPTMLLAAVFFPAAHWFETRRQHRIPSPARDYARLAIAPALLVALLAALNFVRFGSPWDFGYGRMVLGSPGREMLAAFGQFNWRLIPHNFYWFYLAPPIVEFDLAAGARVYFSFLGMSMFLATPAFFYIFLARQPRAVVAAAWCGIVSCAGALLMYYNTGYIQFGHRFGMDYLPLLMLLVVRAAPRRPTVGLVVLIALSMGIQAWGVGAFVGFWPGLPPG